MELFTTLGDTPLPTILVIVGSMFLLLAVVSRIGTYVTVAPKRQKWAAGIGGLLLVLGIGLYLVPPPASEGEQGTLLKLTPSVSSRISSRYSFEDGPMGWIPQDYEDSKACVQVLQSDETAKEGLYSLKMLMDLVGGDTHKSKGEAWVNMLGNPPSGETIPVDLTNRTVTAWVYAPQGSTGDRSKPNGFQVFVKDEEWNSEYGPWKDAVEGQWVQISLTVSTSEPPNGYMARGFDPSRIVAVGVKMGSGGGSTAKFDGAVYIDAVDW
jgi:hypothetical protein